MVNEPYSPPRRPSSDDLVVRERARLGTRVVVIAAVLTFCGFGIAAKLAEVRVPVEVMALPGVAALVAVIACRAPNRRDSQLSTFIVIASGFSVLFGVIGVIGWSGILRVFWAGGLACAFASLALLYRWRAR